MLSGPLYTPTTSEAIRWSRNIPAFLTFGSWALVVTCSLSLKFFDQGLWTPELFSATVFWLKGHTRHLSSSHYASFSGHVCFTPSPSIRKRSPGSCQMQKGYVFTDASTVIIIPRTVVACLIQRWPFLDIPSLSHFCDPSVIFSALLLILLMITVNSLAEEHSACFHSSERLWSWCIFSSSGFLCAPNLKYCNTMWWFRNARTFYSSLLQKYHVSGCVGLKKPFLKAILSGETENNWVECNILQKKGLPLQYVCVATLPSVYETSTSPWNTSAAPLFLAVCSLKWSQAYLSKSQRG